MNNSFRSPYALLTVLLSLALFFRCGEGGSDYKENEGEETATTDSAGNAYPRDMVKEETNLAPSDVMPMEIGGITTSLEKQQLLALLMRQKTDMAYRIEELERMPGDASDNTVVQGDIDKLRAYIDKLDEEIVDVRKAQVGAMEGATESALGAIKGAGALLQSSVMRIDRGF